MNDHELDVPPQTSVAVFVDPDGNGVLYLTVTSFPLVVNVAATGAPFTNRASVGSPDPFAITPPSTSANGRVALDELAMSLPLTWDGVLPYIRIGPGPPC